MDESQTFIFILEAVLRKCNMLLDNTKHDCGTSLMKVANSKHRALLELKELNTRAQLLQMLEGNG